MAIGPAARGLRRVFRLTPDVPQQLPFPGTQRMPEVVPQVFNRVLPPRRSAPLPPLPEDVAVRRGFVPSPQERVRTHTIPYEIEDPVTGVKYTEEAILRAPTSEQTQLLLDAAQISPEFSFGIVANSLKRATNYETLYPVLMQLRALRNEYGQQVFSTTGARISRGAPSSTLGQGGTIANLAGGETVVSSALSREVEDLLDAEVWRAARRVGVPESEIGNISDLVDDSLKTARAQARIKTGYEEDYARIGAIASKAKAKDATPDTIRATINEIEEHLNKVAAKDFSPSELDKMFSQGGYWLSALRKRIGPDEIFELKQVEKAIAEGLPEDKLHAIFLSAIRGIERPDELQALGPLARSAIKSETFLDDIDNAVFERISEIAVRNRERAANAQMFEPSRTRTQLPEMPRQRPPFSLRSTPVRDVYGRGLGRGLPYYFGGDINLENYAVNDLSLLRGRGGGKFSSREIVDPETGQTVFELRARNPETNQFEVIARDPKNPNARRPGVPEYEWIGDPATGRAVRVPTTEFQNFFHRIAEAPRPAGRTLTPIERLRESLEAQSAARGIDPATTKRVADEVEEIINQTISSGKIAEGTPEYAWMHTVFGRLALDVSGPGYLAGTKRTAGLVSHDANHTRRLAALIALDKVEQTGIVPAEALIYLRAQAKRAEDAYELAIKKKPARPKPKRRMSRAEREAVTTPSMTEETEAASIRQLIKESEKAQERLRKAAEKEV